MSLGLFGIAAASFAATNVDNLVVTTAQYAAAPAERVRRITTGQLVGYAVVVAISAAGAATLFEIPTRWIGLLGLVPLALGLRGLVALARRRDTPAGARWPLAAGVTTAALVTIGLGADNLAVYIPLFKEHSVGAGAVVVAYFTVFDVALCVGAWRAGRHPRAVALIERVGHWLSPLVYCVIGVVVLVAAGTLR